jgi:hypothetical protein
MSLVPPNLTILLLSIVLLQTTLPLPKQQFPPSGPHHGDNSDWWSQEQSVNLDNIEPQEREVSGSNLQILGITLNEQMLDKAARRLGKVETIERGDASSGRLQACYASADPNDKIYLVFEQDEVGYSLYLFAAGRPWHGENLCSPSKLVSRSLATESGLHLGLSPSQVIAILGRPTLRYPKGLIYSLHATKRTSTKDLQSAHKFHPELNDEDLVKEYGSYDLGVGIEARFAKSQLVYLGVTKSETN